jgi:hypothetical protein
MTQPRIDWFEDLEAEFARVAAATERAESRRTRGRLGRTLPVFACAALLLGAGYAVPSTRAAMEDITSDFSGWLDGDRGAPGRSIQPADDMPEWIDVDGSRLIAESGGLGLYVTRGPTQSGGTRLTFVLGKDGNGLGNSVDGWREKFKDHAIVVLGTTPHVGGPRETLPLFGLTARSVERVSLRYADGPPLVSENVDGGFVLIADPQRGPDELVAYDGAGHELERVNVSGDRVTAFGVQGQ